MAATNFKNTQAYQLAFSLAMDIFEITKHFPKDERFALIDQIRRSSRSVCANLAEAYRRKKYPAHFVSKACDADAENSETGVWLDFSRDCNYITVEQHKNFTKKNLSVGALLNHMIENPKLY